jgi:hypothetical protein
VAGFCKYGDEPLGSRAMGLDYCSLFFYGTIFLHFLMMSVVW